MKNLRPKFWLSVLTCLVIIGLASWLRLTQLETLPPSPYWEEVALGYDAYSLVKTGRDHHGHPWPIVAFESFGDWKPSGYFYAAAASIKMFGLSVWATRLPAALAGILSVMLIGWLVKILAEIWKISLPNWPIIGLALAAISPWGILFSRAAWEVMLATALFLASLVAVLKFFSAWLASRPSRWGWLVLTVILAVGSMYTYHALRVVTPLVLGWTILILVWQTGLATVWKQFKNQFISTLLLKALALSLGLVLLWPLISNLTSPVITQRFAETSLFSDLAPIIQSNTLIAEHGQQRWAKLIYHRYWFQAKLIGQQYLKHLELGFLFLSGDTNPRHSSQYFGQLYYLDAVFGLLGGFFIWKKHSKLAIWLLGWWLIGTLPAAISLAAPHALRTLPTWPIWVIVISYGLSLVSQNRHWLLVMIGIGYLGSLIWFWQTYSRIYPVLHADVWQSGYCEMYRDLNVLMADQPSLPVFVARSVGRPAMYYWFCNQIEPSLVQAANKSVKKDQGEYLEYDRLKFGDYTAGSAIVATHSAAGWHLSIR